MPYRSVISQDASIYVAGHRGLVGSAMWRRLEQAGCSRLVGFTSSELDLRDRAAVDLMFAERTPDVVVLAAARVGGILANASRPADFLEDNLRIQINVYGRRSAGWRAALVVPGLQLHLSRSSHLNQLREASLIDRRAGGHERRHMQSRRSPESSRSRRCAGQYGMNYISAMPTNLYGT